MIELHPRITIEPDKQAGQPSIRGMRITVNDVLDWLAHGMSEEAILDEHPDLEAEDFRAVYAFAVETLERSYRLLSDCSVIAALLEEVPSLYPLLREAAQPLREAFGESCLLQLEALASEDDATLCVVVKVPFDVPSPADLMRKFKNGWWLRNCSRAEASLVFDYEIGNGV